MQLEQTFDIMGTRRKWMNQDKLHLVNQLFQNETIRTVWDKESEKYYISVVDIVGIVAESDNPKKLLESFKTPFKKGR